MKALHEFDSATDFLRATFDESKRGAPQLTIEKFATELEIGTSSLKMIFSGKRAPTVHLALSAARALKLSPSETAFLETLVLKESARDDWEKAYYSQNLKKLKRELKVLRVGSSQKELLTNPIALPLLVYLLELREKRSDIMNHTDFLARKFQTKASDIRALLEEFQRSGVLEVSTDGGFHVVFEKMNHRHLQKKYIKSLLEQAAKKVDTEYESPVSHFVGYTFTASDDALRRLRLELKSVMEKYMSEATPADHGIQIAQASFQIYPVVKADA